MSHSDTDALLPRQPESWQVWWLATRPKTLPLALSPIILGTAVAWAEGATHAWSVVALALLCATLIQIGTNLHNDARDFEKGNDTPERIGPLRVTSAGLLSSRQVHAAAAVSFAVAFLIGLYLATVTGWPIFALGVISIAAGWAYSGGPKPISYSPFGEFIVWLFFGVAAVMGSHYLQSGTLTLSALLAGSAIGLPAASVLMVNNYRDRDGDIRVGRRTLAVVLDPDGARRAYAAMMLAPFAILPMIAFAGFPGALLAMLTLPMTLKQIRMLSICKGQQLNQVLADTARFGLIMGLALAMGVSL